MQTVVVNNKIFQVLKEFHLYPTPPKKLNLKNATYQNHALSKYTA